MRIVLSSFIYFFLGGGEEGEGGGVFCRLFAPAVYSFSPFATFLSTAFWVSV